MNVLYSKIKYDYDVQLINYPSKNISSLRVKIRNESKTKQKCPEAEFLSIIIPPDVFLNCFETALYSNSKGVVYNEELGYDDICRFSNSNEVIKELERLDL